VTDALLLSGGMDSIALAWWLRPAWAITIDYGQRPAAAEISAAGAVAGALGITHLIITVDCRELGSGDMAGSPPSAHAPASEWWPYRNQLIITLAAMKAIALGSSRLLVGTVASDEFHQDGTVEFFTRISALTAYQEGGLVVEAPAIKLSTIELIRQSAVPDSILAWAHSCHRADVACGECRGCNKYFQTRQELSYGLG
jgi:7-cyano-7-deazaguanine synthase